MHGGTAPLVQTFSLYSFPRMVVTVADHKASTTHRSCDHIWGGVFTCTQREQDILASAWIINISVLLSDHSILFAQMPGYVDILQC